MSLDLGPGIAPGDLHVTVLTTNETNATLLDDPRFAGEVSQPLATGAMLMGEHGFSALVEVGTGDAAPHRYLLDTGGLKGTVVENARALGVKLDEVEKLILSHGHVDHAGGLAKVIPALAEGTELWVHPAAFVQNHIVVTEDGAPVPLDGFTRAVRGLKREGKLKYEMKLPQTSRPFVEKLCADAGVTLREVTAPTVVCPGFGTSGEIALADPAGATPGFYLLKSRKDVVPQTFRDEIALVFHVQDKGLVVLTGCGHCGVVNTVKHARALTGVETVHAVIGGFHEEWNPPARVQATIDELLAFEPKLVCGMHCTGFRFNALLADHPARVAGIAGTQFHF